MKALLMFMYHILPVFGVPLPYRTLVCTEDMERKLKQFFFRILVDVKGFEDC